MAKIYARWIREGKTNTETGSPWTLEDVPERWRVAVQEQL